MWTWTLRRLTKSKSVRLIGIDFDRESLKRASKILGARTTFIAADASFLPLKDNCIDYVTCRRLLINLGRRKRRDSLREMIRVARVGGVVSPVEPSLQTNKANRFSTVRGGQQFSRRLEKAVSGTDFTLGPRIAHILVQEGLARVKVWAYLLVDSILPPKYHSMFLNPVVHGGGFAHALTTVHPPFRGNMASNLAHEAEKLDREVKKQMRRKAFVSVSATPVFIARGTKPSLET